MQAPNSKTAEFRCGLGGVISKLSPDLLRDGQYRKLSNIISTVEGAVSSRTGIKQVGVLDASLPTCYFAKKLLTTPGENPLVPATNSRYLGILTAGAQRNIYRTKDYQNLENGGSPVVTAADSVASRHWEMAEYAAGSSGAPWAYFACPNGMFKDSGVSPYAALPKWGIQPATGVCLAAAVTGDVAITAVVPSEGTNIGVIVTLASPAAISDFDMLTIAGSGMAVVTTDGRTSLDSTWDIRIGVPDANQIVQDPTTRFRIFDSNGQAVTTSATYGGGGSVTGVPASGNLDGGAESSPNNTQPYDWLMAYDEAATGDRGNPSQLMSASSAATLTAGGVTYSGKQFSIHNGQAKVVIWGTGLAGIGSVRVYRRGGTLSDEVGRLVAVIALSDPGWQTLIGGETYFVFTDNTADADLVFAEQWETDNDPPVPSTPPAPITSTASGSISPGWQLVNLTGGTPFASVTPGSLVHVIDADGTNEAVYIYTVTGATFTAYFQFAHAAGVTVEVDAITGQPCNLAVTIESQGAICVAGDPNNPHILYKSKNGRPQSFPIGTDAAGAITTIGVGTPSNGIVNMVEQRGQIFCMNVNSAFEVAVIKGSLTEPAQVSGKGLRGQSAWCKTDTEEVWYLSDDGVWSWNGSILQKRTEAIDPVFHGQQINDISPIDMTKTAPCRMAFRRGVVYLLYVDIAGNYREIACEPMYSDRWTPINWELQGTPEYPITAVFCEPDTKSLIISLSGTSTAGGTVAGATFGIADTTVVSAGTNFTSDWWTSSVSGNGDVVPWEIVLPWFDMGQPAMMKLFEEIWLDIDPQLYTGVYNFNSTINVELRLNYSDAAVDTFKVAIPSGTSLTGRQILSLLPNLINTSGSIYQSYGREARAISFRLYGQAYPVQMTLYRIIFRYQETGEVSAGAAADWMDLGSKHDKRLYQMAVIFDTAGTDRQIVLEPRGGREGKTAGTAQVFTLSSPTDLGSGRAMKVFPLADPTVGKLFRVRPYATTSISGGNTLSSVDLFRILEVTFPDAEEYPPDIVSRAGRVVNGKVTEARTTGGYDYDKYLNQVTFEVNTNGVAVTVQLQADGANIGAAFTITATDTDRQRNVTIPAGLKGKSWSIFVDPTQAALTSGSGIFQLFNLGWKFQQADKGEVGHTFDWDDLGHPWDKYLNTLAIEWDDTGGADVTLQLDTLSGIGGQTVTSDIMSATPITLTGGRGKKTFALPVDTIAKMIRLYPKGSTIPVGFKQWKYSFDKVDYPADNITSTGWVDASGPNDKNPSWLWIDADTANVAASVILQRESGTATTVSHTGTATNRKANYPIPIDTIGKMWRLKPTAGVNGKYQQFGWGFARWRPFPQDGSEDPPDVVLWTPWNDFGYPFGKIARSLVITIDTGGIQCSVTLESQEGSSQTFPVTTNYTTRRQVLTCNANLVGTQWRLRLSPGTGGKAKLWDWALDSVKLPPLLTRWSSNKQGFGYKGWKFLGHLWMDYSCNSSITITFTSDTGVLAIQLPAHSVRAVERRPFPDVWGAGLNKSELYQVDVVSNDANSPFQVFPDVSGLEWLACGGDRHAAFQQIAFSEFMTIPI